MMNERNLDTAQKLMLIQGIDLINDGLQFIAWAEGFPNELAFDLYDLLIECAIWFQACVLNGEHDNLIIDRAKKHMKNIKHCQELNEKIQKQLQELREQVAVERQNNKE